MVGKVHILAQAGWTGTFVNMLPVIGIVLIIASLWLGIRKRRKRAKTEPTAREQLERMKQQQGMRDDLQSLMVEIEQLSKRLSSQLDSKTLHLEKLLSEAEQKIAELRRLREEANGPESFHSRATKDPSATESARRGGELQNRTARVDASGMDDREKGDTSDSDRAAGPSDPVTRSIYDLADQGKPAADIAGELNEHLGKVELILALRQS